MKTSISPRETSPVAKATMGLVMNMRFIFGDDRNDVLFSSRVCSLAMDVISLESRRFIFMYLYMRTQSIQKQTIEYDKESKNS